MNQQVHIPAVFVSSTSYDLDQIRADLKQFIEALGYDAVLSEYSSFPIDPDIKTVENCLRAVDRRADIFVLVVGGRYGSQTDEGKSVTNLEYLRARLKEIPIYVFVTKSIIHILPVWKSNPNADFKSVADSPKLFQFVDELMNSEKVWVYSFERAQDIMNILKTQLAYLFLESLELRRKFRQAHLSEALVQLQGEALRLVVEKPEAWEGRLFNQILLDKIVQLRNRRRDLEYRIALGQELSITNITELLPWLQNKLSEILRLISSADRLVNTVWRTAIGQPGNAEYLVHVARRVAEVYQRLVEWTEDFHRVPADDRHNAFIDKFSAIGIQMLTNMENFSEKLRTDVENALPIHASSDEPIRIEAKLEFSFLTDFEEDIQRLVQNYQRDLQGRI